MVAWSDVGGVRAYSIPDIEMNTASLERASGDDGPAIDRLRRLTLSHPKEPGAWIELAATFERAGRIDEARSTWADARTHLAQDPALASDADAFARRHP
jgi:Flp pilus assembly protein TadD